MGANSSSSFGPHKQMSKPTQIIMQSDSTGANLDSYK